MNTNPGFERCIGVGPLFDELLEGFIILFSHIAIANYQWGGTWRKYQVTLREDSYVQTSSESQIWTCTIH